jgi:hypothetical protein
MGIKTDFMKRVTSGLTGNMGRMSHTPMSTTVRPSQARPQNSLQMPPPRRPMTTQQSTSMAPMRPPPRMNNNAMHGMAPRQGFPAALPFQGQPQVQQHPGGHYHMPHGQFMQPPPPPAYQTPVNPAYQNLSWAPPPMNAQPQPQHHHPAAMPPPYQPPQYQRPPVPVPQPPQPVRRHSYTPHDGSMPYNSAPVHNRPLQHAPGMGQQHMPPPYNPAQARPTPPRRRDSEPILPSMQRPHMQEMPQVGGFAGPFFTEAQARPGPGRTVSDTMAHEGGMNALSDRPTQAAPHGYSHAQAAPPPYRPTPQRRATMEPAPVAQRPVMERPSMENDYRFWEPKPGLSTNAQARPVPQRRQSAPVIDSQSMQRPSGSVQAQAPQERPQPQRRYSEGDMPRMRRNPETGEMVPWAPVKVEQDDGSYEQAQTQALALRARITGRTNDKFDIKDPLDARCLEAALQGSSMVSLAEIDMSRYR